MHPAAAVRLKPKNRTVNKLGIYPPLIALTFYNSAPLLRPEARACGGGTASPARPGLTPQP